MSKLVARALDVEEEAELAQVAGTVAMSHELQRMAAGQLLKGLADQFQQCLSKEFDQIGLPLSLGASLKQLGGEDRPEGSLNYLNMCQNTASAAESFCGRRSVGRQYFQ